MLVVSWGSGVDPRGLLRSAVAWYCGVAPGSVGTGSLCPRCGSDEHGRPYVRLTSGLAAPHVSLSRAGALVAVAVTDAGPVGVDVELAGAASFAGFDQVALHPAERADDDEARTRTWVRKESLLKATGDGLRVDPRTVRLTAPSDPPAVLEWPALRGVAWLYDVEPAPGFIAGIAVLAPMRPPLVLRAAELPAATSASPTAGRPLA